MAAGAFGTRLQAKKSLGQHFLSDGNILRKIVAAAGDLAGTHVIEIGPGPGGLTRALLATTAASVTAIEIDARAVGLLQPLVERSEGRLTVLQGDARVVDIVARVPPPRQIIANLPYNVASPLLVDWLARAEAFTRLTLMFQAEVAERITARPGSAAYGRLGVLAQWTTDATIALRVAPGAFVPRPRVSSALVSLIPHSEQPRPDLFRAMQRLTAAAFGQRRKMLRSALKPLNVPDLLDLAGISPVRRAETLSIAEFDALARLLARSGPDD